MPLNSTEVMALIRASCEPHYVYYLYRPSGEPFYVGVGTGRRILDHEILAKRPEMRSRKLSVIRKIWRLGFEVGYGIHGWFARREDAEVEEAKVVQMLGRIDLGTGILTNQTAGGEGVPELSPERAAAKAAGNRAAWQGRDKKAAMQHLRSAEVQARAAASRQGKSRGKYAPRDNNWITPELRARRSAMLKANPISQRADVRAKISAARKGPAPNHWTRDPSHAGKFARGAHPRAKPIILDGVAYACLRDAAEALGVTPETAKKWAQNPSVPRGRWPAKV